MVQLSQLVEQAVRQKAVHAQLLLQLEGHCMQAKCTSRTFTTPPMALLRLACTDSACNDFQCG